MKYVQNKRNASVTGKFVTKDGEQRTIIFPVYTINKYTGTTLEDGFTMVSDEDFEALTAKKGGSFNAFIASKELVVYDKKPESIMTPADMIVSFREKVKALEVENEALRKQLAELTNSSQSGKTKTNKKEDLPKDGESEF